MAVNDSALLILREMPSSNRLVRMIEVKPGAFVFPLRWLISGRARGSQMLDASLKLSRVDGVSMTGIPTPRVLGAPLFAYVLLLLLGWLSLSTPLLVRLRLSEQRTLTLDEAKEFVGQFVQDDQMDSGVAARLRQKLLRAKSVTDMASAVAQSRD